MSDIPLGPPPSLEETMLRLFEELHDRIDRLEEKLAWQLAAPTLSQISTRVGDPVVAENQAKAVVQSYRDLIRSRDASPTAD